MTFPLNPTNGQTHTTVGGTVYTYNTAKGAWYVVTGTTISGPPPATGTLLAATGPEVIAGINAVKYVTPKALADASTSNSGGAGDANKLVKLNGAGKLNSSLIPNDIMEYKGRVLPTSTAPAAPDVGHVYVMSAAGVADPSWIGIGGTPLAASQMLIWDGTSWVPTGGGTAAVDTFSSPVGTIVNTGANGSNLMLDVSMTGLASAAQASTPAENLTVTPATTVLTNIGGTFKEVPLSVLNGANTDTFTSTGGTIVNLGADGSNLDLDVNHDVLFDRPAVATVGELAAMTGTEEVLVQLPGGVRQVSISNMLGLLPPDVFLQSLAYNSGTGDLVATLNDSGATTITVALDGRYVQTLNAVAPDALGNVPLSLTAVETGTVAARPAAPADATIYVVSGNTADPTQNGKTYIYQTSTLAWYEIVGYDVASMDARYINNAGDTMLGQLLLNADPTVALEAATKQYVDAQSVNTFVSTGGSIIQSGANGKNLDLDVNVSALDALIVDANAAEIAALTATSEIYASIGGVMKRIPLSAVSSDDQTANQVNMNTSVAAYGFAGTTVDAVISQMAAKVDWISGTLV